MTHAAPAAAAGSIAARPPSRGAGRADSPRRRTGLRDPPAIFRAEPEAASDGQAAPRLFRAPRPQRVSRVPDTAPPTSPADRT